LWFVEMAFELVEAGAPHLAIGLEPVVELHQRFDPEVVQPSLTLRTDGYQPGVSHH
jgi:hypothetical protein